MDSQDFYGHNEKCFESGCDHIAQLKLNLQSILAVLTLKQSILVLQRGTQPFGSDPRSQN